MRFLPRTLSIDDVMQMVDTEDGDILVLTDLVREESGISQNSGATTSSSDESNSHVVISKSFDANLFQRTRLELPETLQPGYSSLGRLRLSPSRPSVVDIEALEELEDRIALGQASPIDSSVRFRSSTLFDHNDCSGAQLSEEAKINDQIIKTEAQAMAKPRSLIPEQVPSTVEECEEPSESSHALSMEENTDSPPTRRSRLHSMFSSILRRKSKDMSSPRSESDPP
ncbi:unnamed protein product [Cylicocyclus nassatus]|uniref:Uncharacterized protein n=1 Tax=Cylicocyclus nassatus TaxID=53992 RepID=A0AA36DR44_CYLNA|nr:unnamed protein product [Cylicocyclus nassatus]